MRIGEVLALTRGDVDLSNGVVKVINGKNGVSRYVPISDSLKRVLNRGVNVYNVRDFLGHESGGANHAETLGYSC